MRWLKYLLISLAGLLSVCVLLIVSVILFLGQDDLSDALIYVVDKTSDHHLEIEGPLTITRSLSPVIEASGLHFRMDSEAFEFKAEHLQLQLDLLPLASGQLHVFDARARDGTVTVRQMFDDEQDDEPDKPLELSALIIDRIHLENLSVDLLQSHEIEPLHVKLDVFHAKRDADGIISPLTSRGTVDGEPFSLDGSLSRGVSSRTGERPFLLNFHADVLHSTSHIEGEVVRSAEATTVDLAVQLDVADVSAVLALFHIGMPPLGALTATGNLTGSLDALQLGNLESRLAKDGVELTTSGLVENLNAGTGFELQHAANITDARLLAWILTDEIPEYQSVQSKWKTSGDIGRLHLVAEQLQAANDQGHRLNISGDITILDADPFVDKLQASVELSAPNLDYVRQFSEAVPDLGSVKASANVSLHDGVIAIQDIKATSAVGKTGRVSANGSIGHISFTPVEVSGMTFKARIEDVTAKQLGEALDIDLPELGSINAQANYSGSLHKSTVSNLQLQAGSPGKLLVDVSGELQLGDMNSDMPLAGAMLDLSIQTPDSAKLSVFTGTDVPALGAFKAEAKIRTANGITGISSLQAGIKRGNDFSLQLTGSVGDLQTLADINMRLGMNAADLYAIGAPFDLDLPREGAVNLTGDLRGSFEQISFTGHTRLRNTTISSDLTGRFAGEHPGISGAIRVPVLDIHDIGLHPERLVQNSGAASSAPADAADNGKPTGTVPLFSTESIDLSGLQSVNLDLEVSIDALASTDAAIDKIYTHLLLKNGLLEIKPAKLSVDGDEISASVTINSKPEVPTMAFTFGGHDVDLGLLLKNSPEQPAPIRGVMTADADMHTRGHSTAELAANLTGTVHMVTENAKVKKSDLNLVNMDVTGWIISNTLSLEKDMNVGCAILSMTFNNGEGATDVFLFDTPDTLIRIDADIDLRDETMYIAILPTRKIKLLGSRKPMEISGPITNPEYKLVSLKDLTVETSRAALLAPLTITGAVLGNFSKLIGVKRKEEGTCDKFIDS